MDAFSVVGATDAVHHVLAALRPLGLAGPPPTSVVVASGDHGRLLSTVTRVAMSFARVIVVSVGPIPEHVVDSVVPLVDDFLEWGRDTVSTIANRLQRWREIEAVVHGPIVQRVAAGASAAHMDALAQIVELARWSAGPVLLTGETGTGKEVAARLLHDLSPRSDAPLVIVDGATMQPTLSGSELFGHERGAFTGAHSSRTGAFAHADGGMLFLDEIGELPLSIQAELLRVIQERTYKRVGGDRWMRSDFRLVCATNRDLLDDIETGRFRADLYHRIAAGVVHLAPLRDRLDDIEALFSTFVSEALGTTGQPIAPSVVRLLRGREYPGNLRDLRQLASRVAARHIGSGPITIGDVPKPDRNRSRHPSQGREPNPDGEAVSATTVHDAVRVLMSDGRTMPAVIKLVSDVMVDLALVEAGGSSRAAAMALGVSPRAVQARRAAARMTSNEEDELTSS